MEDKAIVALYLERSERAIEETAKKYGSYLHSISNSILASSLDAEECVNDAYNGAWNSIPPQKPESLGAYIGKIVRNLSLNRLKSLTAQKRAGNNYTLVLDELEEVIPSLDGDMSDDLAIRDALNSFLEALPSRIRTVFVKRYWYMKSINEIAHEMGMTENNVKVILSRARKSLGMHLADSGIII